MEQSSDKRRKKTLKWRERTGLVLLLLTLNILDSFGCGNQAAPAAHESARREQVLPLTFGGFLKDGSEAEKMDGVCRTDTTRNLLNCDIYNGLPGWTISEVVLRVTWFPYVNGNVRDYRVSVIIKPLTTENVSVRLGLQLPPGSVIKRQKAGVETVTSWSWLIVGAKGYP